MQKSYENTVTTSHEHTLITDIQGLANLPRQNSHCFAASQPLIFNDSPYSDLHFSLPPVSHSIITSLSQPLIHSFAAPTHTRTHPASSHPSSLAAEKEGNPVSEDLCKHKWRWYCLDESPCLRSRWGQVENSSDNVQLHVNENKLKMYVVMMCF